MGGKEGNLLNPPFLLFIGFRGRGKGGIFLAFGARDDQGGKGKKKKRDLEMIL